MKFLVSTCPKDERPRSSPTAAEFEAHIAWFRARLADKTIDLAGHAEGRALFIFNAPSPAELETLMDTIPLAGQMKWMIEPLTDFFEHTARVTAYLKSQGTSAA